MAENNVKQQEQVQEPAQQVVEKPGKVAGLVANTVDKVKKALPYVGVAVVAAGLGWFCANPKGNVQKIKGKLGLDKKESNKEKEGNAEKPQQQQGNNKPYYNNNNNRNNGSDGQSGRFER